MCDSKDVTVHLLGGDLKITWDEESGDVYMEGPAATVFTGEIGIIVNKRYISDTGRIMD